MTTDPERCPFCDLPFWHYGSLLSHIKSAHVPPPAPLPHIAGHPGIPNTPEGVRQLTEDVLARERRRTGNFGKELRDLGKRLNRLGQAGREITSLIACADNERKACEGNGTFSPAARAEMRRMLSRLGMLGRELACKADDVLSWLDGLEEKGSGK